MSRSYRHPSDYSRGSSPNINRDLAVTEDSFSNLALSQTAGPEPYPSSPYYSLDQHRRRPSSRGAYSSSYLLPDSVPSSSYTPPDQSTAFEPTFAAPDEYLLPPSRTNMGSYPYPELSTYEPSSYIAPMTSQRGFASPSEALSRSMSGPSGPSILPSSAYDGFRDVEREVARQRRRNVHDSRRQSKLLLRRTVLPSTSYSRSSEVDHMSGSIDYLAAQSGASYGSQPYPGRTPSTTSSAQASLYPYVSSSPYPYSASCATGNLGPQGFNSSSQGRSISASVYSSYDENSRASAINLGKDAYEPVIVETPKKPQCWDHGCNGRQFSTFSNLLRHQREKSGTSQKSVCHRCGAEFTRKTARDGHLAHDKCKRT